MRCAVDCAPLCTQNVGRCHTFAVFILSQLSLFADVSRISCVRLPFAPLCNIHQSWFIGPIGGGCSWLRRLDSCSRNCQPSKRIAPRESDPPASFFAVFLAAVEVQTPFTNAQTLRLQIEFLWVYWRCLAWLFRSFVQCDFHRELMRKIRIPSSPPADTNEESRRRNRSPGRMWVMWLRFCISALLHARANGRKLDTITRFTFASPFCTPYSKF